VTLIDTPRLEMQPKPLLGADKTWWEQFALYAFVVIPFLAFAAAVPAAWGWGLSWIDAALTVAFYFATLLGVTVGFHRLFTHKSFTANRGLKIALAIVGSCAAEGPTIMWVADHRRHHAYSDKDGDPHSPWRFGPTLPALVKGMWFAHVGWLFRLEQTNQSRFAPDLLKDRDLVRIEKQFPLWTAITLTLPALLGGLLTMSWAGALSAFFWAGLVRIMLVHHVTWSVNSVCHVIGQRPFATRDKSANFWPLAILSGGESWHNMHHADPTAARHGVLRGQIDISARLIWIFERLGWATCVRWPTVERLARLASTPNRTTSGDYGKIGGKIGG
jgi:stearoyl-CoA desaturase (delta-9 desaturase)